MVDYTLANATVTIDVYTPQQGANIGGGSSVTYGCKDPTALNYNANSSSNPALCEYPATPIPTVRGSSSYDKWTGSRRRIILLHLRLKKGSTGNEVLELQKFLNVAGYNCGTPDGKFGLRTKLEVISFQLANHLKADGIVGTGTRAILNK